MKGEKQQKESRRIRSQRFSRGAGGLIVQDPYNAHMPERKRPSRAENLYAEGSQLVTDQDRGSIGRGEKADVPEGPPPVAELPPRTGYGNRSEESSRGQSRNSLGEEGLVR